VLSLAVANFGGDFYVEFGANHLFRSILQSVMVNVYIYIYAYNIYITIYMSIIVWLILNSFDWGRRESSFLQHPAPWNNKDKYVYFICKYKYVHLWLIFTLSSVRIILSAASSAMRNDKDKYMYHVYIKCIYMYIHMWIHTYICMYNSRKITARIIFSAAYAKCNHQLKTRMYITYNYINMYICD